MYKRQALCKEKLSVNKVLSFRIEKLGKEILIEPDEPDSVYWGYDVITSDSNLYDSITLSLIHIFNTNRNAIGNQLINSNKNTLQNQIYIHTSENAKGIELQDSKDNTIIIQNLAITSNNIAYGIISNGTLALHNNNNSFTKSYGTSTITSNKSIGIFLENSNNIKVSCLDITYSYIHYKIIGNYAREILTKNSNNTKIFNTLTYRCV